MLFTFSSTSRPARAAVLGLTLFAGSAIGTGCGSTRPAAAPLLPTPTPVPVEYSLSVPSTDLAIAAFFDTTSSADRFAAEAKLVLASSLAAWTSPGRGGIDISINTLSSRSWDEESQRLVARLDGLPAAPVLRTTLARPGAVQVAVCDANTFSRAKCIADATDHYNAALTAALEDEAKAEAELDVAFGAFTALAESRRQQADALAQRIIALDLGRDSTGSDISGALLRGAETLRASRASKRVMLIQSDLIPSGPQHPGSLDLRGIDIVTFFFDCPQGVDCGAHRDAYTNTFLAAGAASVSWLDVGASRLVPSILEEVR